MFESAVDPLDCVHVRLGMDLHFCIHTCGCAKQHGLLFHLICGGVLLFQYGKPEGWMVAQATKR